MKNAITMTAIATVLGLSVSANPAAAADLKTAIRIQGEQALAELAARNIRELHEAAGRLDMPGVTLRPTREMAMLDDEALCPVPTPEAGESEVPVTAELEPVATEEVSG